MIGVVPVSLNETAVALNALRLCPISLWSDLVNKTNQFNLNGRRYTQAEWQEGLQTPGSFALAISYHDKFGFLGKIAVVDGKRDGDALVVEAWVMSCRAFSRRIEHQTIAQLLGHFEAKEIVLDFAPTAKNKPLSDFLKEMVGKKPKPDVRLGREAFTEKCPKLYHQIVEKNGNTKEKLIQVFETVFPDLPAERITSATQDSIQSWDSVAAITLMNLVEEEFAIQMDFEDLGELTSFQKILAYVNGKLAQTTA